MNWFFHAKSQLFQNFPLHSLRSTCHSTCPLPQRILLSKRTSRLYESLPCAPATLILRQQAILRFQSALAAWKSLIFMKFHHHDPKWRNLSLLKICARSVSGRETWQIRILMPNAELQKYTELKRIGDFSENHQFSTEILHIVCGRLATQHARCQ